MPPQKIKTDYEPIDTDPHFTRVVRYFRNSDYLVWAATTAFEYERDLKEMRQRIKEGKPLYGVSRMNEYAQNRYYKDLDDNEEKEAKI
ncbi:127_t:CDS:2 [Racocetra fulgida]|uniref:127_t:CDS:1 n=1 Tax=Racocetra fulgida TaxID=60492 RepID=A0A9N8VJH0_9GLOM|nr:127_t:CDS:2 [Racocetra fulgida]